MFNGRRDRSNGRCAFIGVSAVSPDALARMFERHPHVTMFPGDAIEVMSALVTVPQA